MSLFRRLVLVVGIVILAGCERPGSVAPYQESTINRFMAACLGDTPVAVCVCLLESTQRQIPEPRLSGPDPVRVVEQQKSRLGKQCAQTLAATRVTDTDAKSLESPLVNVADQRLPPTTVASSEPLSEQIAGPIEKPANLIETCVQERVLEATLKSKDGSVSIATFDRIQLECKHQS
jgi:hypothetical protein